MLINIDNVNTTIHILTDGGIILCRDTQVFKLDKHFILSLRQKYNEVF